MKETFGLRLEKEDKEWIMSHSNPQEFMRNLVRQARFGQKPRLSHGDEPTTEPFDYEAFEKQGVDCRFGKYLPQKRKVFCQCTYPSVLKLKLGKNRLIEPWICNAHFESKTFEDLLTWVDAAAKVREEAKKEEEKPKMSLYERKLAEREQW